MPEMRPLSSSNRSSIGLGKPISAPAVMSRAFSFWIAGAWASMASAMARRHLFLSLLDRQDRRREAEWARLAKSVISSFKIMDVQPSVKPNRCESHLTARPVRFSL